MQRKRVTVNRAQFPRENLQLRGSPVSSRSENVPREPEEFRTTPSRENLLRDSAKNLTSNDDVRS